MAQLESVPRTLLRERAYEAIRDALVRGAIAPGASLNNAELAAQLGLSRAPVREALARLAGEGLVETKPQSYTRASAVVVRDIRDAAAVVRAMHELAARAAVPRLSGEDVAAMRRANARFGRSARAGDLDAALAADDDLHGVLVRVCDNRAVAATIDRYTALVRRLERLRFGQVGGHPSAELHEQLIDACAAGDAERAAQVNGRIWQALENLADDADPRPDDTP
jgi:DNA-binding GntR family transcriptional regulator